LAAIALTNANDKKKNCEKYIRSIGSQSNFADKLAATLAGSSSNKDGVKCFTGQIKALVMWVMYWRSEREQAISADRTVSFSQIISRYEIMFFESLRLAFQKPG
jgi:hypothetical protein